MVKFSLGQIVMTRGVSDYCEENNIGGEELSGLIRRHANGDWGDICKEDKKENNSALKEEGRLMSSYSLKGKTFWVITEWDRSATTILFPDEY